MADLFEIEMPIPIVVDTENELTIDDIENDRVATPEETGVATIITNSISDTWQKINDYNSIISTISSSGIKDAEEIISVIKDIVDDENKNVGKLTTILQRVSPSTDNIEVGKEEVMMKLVESINEDKLHVIEDILGRKLSTTQENEIYDGWGAFYKDPESYRNSPIIKLINTDLDSSEYDDLDDTDEDEPDLDDSEDYEEEDGDQIVIDDDFIDESLVEKLEKTAPKKTYRIGTPQYDANEGRKKRISLYKKLTNIDENVQLTEGALKKWAVDRVACFTNTTPERVKNELLGNKWSEFEEG